MPHLATSPPILPCSVILRRIPLHKGDPILTVTSNHSPLSQPLLLSHPLLPLPGPKQTAGRIKYPPPLFPPHPHMIMPKSSLPSTNIEIGEG